MKLLTLTILIAIGACLAWAGVAVLWYRVEEEHLSIEDVGGEVVTNFVGARAEWVFFDEHGAGYRSSTSVGYGAGSNALMQAMQADALRLGSAANVTEPLTPIQVESLP